MQAFGILYMGNGLIIRNSIPFLVDFIHGQWAYNTLHIPFLVGPQPFQDAPCMEKNDLHEWGNKLMGFHVGTSTVRPIRRLHVDTPRWPFVENPRFGRDVLLPSVVHDTVQVDDLIVSWVEELKGPQTSWKMGAPNQGSLNVPGSKVPLFPYNRGWSSTS